MTAPTTPRPKSPPKTPKQAGNTSKSTHPSVKDVGRQAVLSGLREDAQRWPQGWSDGRVPLAWLHVVAPPDWRATPSGRSWCECGYDRHTIGRAATVQLVRDHEEHRQTCPLLSNFEGRAAA
jgi:hypothetical protein